MNGKIEENSETVEQEWFEVHSIDESTFVIEEPMHVRSHLIVGTERAVLFDSGLGVAPIRPVVASLTDLPITIVNSHHHFDHVGGNHEFDEIAIHREGVDLLAAGPPPEWLNSYWAGVSDWMLALDADVVSVGSSAPSRPRPLPAEFDPQHPVIVPSAATRPLEGGEQLSLGGRDLVVLHTPGHTRDSICLLDRERGMLFGGDTLDTGAIYAHLPTADLPDFIRSVEQLDDALPHSVETILSPHGRTGQESRTVIGDLARALRHAAHPRAMFEPGTDCFRHPAAVLHEGDFWIYLPISGEDSPE